MLSITNVRAVSHRIVWERCEFVCAAEKGSLLSRNCCDAKIQQTPFELGTVRHRALSFFSVLFDIEEQRDDALCAVLDAEEFRVYGNVTVTVPVSLSMGVQKVQR